MFRAIGRAWRRSSASCPRFPRATMNIMPRVLRGSTSSGLSRASPEQSHRLDDPIDVAAGEVVEKGQAHEAFAHPLGHRALPRTAAQALAHRREVERHVMKNAVNPSGAEVCDEGGTLLERSKEQVEHVIRLVAMRG